MLNFLLIAPLINIIIIIELFLSEINFYKAFIEDRFQLSFNISFLIFCNPKF